MTNLWKRFQDLIPKQPITVARVSGVGGDTFPYLVTMVDGGVQKVCAIGSYSFGERVYVRDGQIIGKAPPATTDYVLDV